MAKRVAYLGEREAGEMEAAAAAAAVVRFIETPEDPLLRGAC